MEIGNALATESDGVGYIVAQRSSSVHIVDAEIIVEQLVCGGCCEVIRARSFATAQSRAAQDGLWRIAPKIAATCIDVHSQLLGRRSKSDIGEIETPQVVQGLGHLASSEVVSVRLDQILKRSASLDI